MSDGALRIFLRARSASDERLHVMQTLDPLVVFSPLDASAFVERLRRRHLRSVWNNPGAPVCGADTEAGVHA
jgi:hypothetical protein